MSSLNSHWRPDWRDVTQYPCSDCKNFSKWGWEFLRRNAKFAEDLKKFESSPYDECQCSEGGVYCVRCDEQIRLSKYYCLNIRGDRNYQVSENWSEIIQFVSGQIKCHSYYPDADYTSSTPRNIAECIIRFDVCMPLKPQLQKAETYLKALQATVKDTFEDFPKPEIMRKTDDFQKCLRLLDAVEDKATVQEIAKELYGQLPPLTDTTYSTIKDLKERANRYRDMNYRHVASFSSPIG